MEIEVFNTKPVPDEQFINNRKCKECGKKNKMDPDRWTCNKCRYKKRIGLKSQ